MKFILLFVAGFLSLGTHAGADETVTASEGVVKRGETVTIVSELEGVRLSSTGRVLKDGKTGDTIPVFNLATSRTLQGLVKDGWVEVRPRETPLP